MAQPALHFHGVELIHNTCGAIVEFLAIFGRPPVFQIPGSVELRSLIVKPVAHFVADHSADCSVIRSVIGSHVEHGRLQYAGGKRNLVLQWTVISVDGGRSHTPIIPIHWFADFRQRV